MRIVLKVGSTLLSSDKTTSGLDETFIGHLVKQIGALHQEGHEIILVTSGAIASGGFGASGYPASRAAMVGQVKLMGVYLRFFNELSEKIRIGQALYTYHDLEDDREHRTKEHLLEGFQWREITIVNANDAVMDEEIQALSSLADNDQLAAKIAVLVQADLLVFLTDVEGLYRNYGQAGEALVREVDLIDAEIISLAFGTNSAVSKGGMLSKVRAAKLACENGVEVAVVNGRRPNVLLERVHAGDSSRPGTTFLACPSAVF